MGPSFDVLLSCILKFRAGLKAQITLGRLFDLAPPYLVNKRNYLNAT